MTMITLLAFLAAVLGPLFPQRAEAGEPCAMMMDMADHSHGTQKGAPMPGCGDLSCCIVMCALPATAEPVATPFAWAGVGYWASTKPLTGVTVSPDPSPPRSRA
jgi:hypothetical protein